MTRFTIHSHFLRDLNKVKKVTKPVNWPYEFSGLQDVLVGKKWPGIDDSF